MFHFHTEIGRVQTRALGLSDTLIDFGCFWWMMTGLASSVVGSSPGSHTLVSERFIDQNLFLSETK